MNSEVNRAHEGGVLASSWYARMLGGGLIDVEEAIDDRVPGPLLPAVRRLALLRGLAVWALAGRGGALVLKRGERGALTAIAAAAWLGRRRVVILELAVPPRSPSRWRRALRTLWRRLGERPALRRVVVGAQTTTEAERHLCSRAYGIPLGRIQHVPWAWSIEGRGAPHEPRDGVLASGRAACDWPTLFAAAAGRPWPLTVVCGRADLAAVSALNADGRARVLCEIPREEHHRLLRSAAAYVVALVDVPGSAGQVRLAAATEAGAPVVASAVAALAGYAVAGQTAILVRPGDPVALRDAVERLLSDRAEARRLAGAALERARAWTYASYFAAIRELVAIALAGRQLPARAPAAPPEEG
jgi:glycosyltransferase involved in cell wall biosynthesis